LVKKSVAYFLNGPLFVFLLSSYCTHCIGLQLVLYLALLSCSCYHFSVKLHGLLFEQIKKEGRKKGNKGRGSIRNSRYNRGGVDSKVCLWEHGFHVCQLHCFSVFSARRHAMRKPSYRMVKIS